MVLPESPMMTETKLKRIAELSAANPEMVFAQVIHHINEKSLQACFQELDGKKAIGSDGIDKEEYGKHLEANLKDLMSRIRRMAYVPGAVRQVLIPKEGKAGATRPLGISNFEDKLVQRMIHKLLESIYEPLFFDDSYGFRPGRGCHDALKGLISYLDKHEVETVLDVDLANYFGSIPHEEALKVVGKKISDPRLLRYLRRMFKSGLLVDGELQVSDEGVVQGSVCSPIIANIFAHEVIDRWIEETVKPRCAGEVKWLRYADDLVICCKYQEDAERIKAALFKRLERYGLKMNEAKTKLVKFSYRKQSRNQKQETFDFLGFTVYWGKSRKGRYLVKLRTSGKRFRSKLKKVNEWARAIRNRISLNQIMKIAAAKTRGHIQYYGVSHNVLNVNKFIYVVKEILFKWLNRRSQRKSFSWEEFDLYLKRIEFPKAKVCHKLF